MPQTSSPELALITGGSMGLGEEYARQLAARGVSLILTARSEDKLRALATELSSQVAVHVFPCDLAAPGAADRIVQWLAEQNLRPNWLINNAGFGTAGAFEKLPPDCVRDICMVNMVALSELTARMLPQLKALPRGTARILNLASVAGFQPIPYFGVYAASKAYVLSFSEALYEELKSHRIRVLAVCPSYTSTNFADNNSVKKKYFKHGQSPVEVVRMSLEASDAGRPVVITRNTAQIFALRFTPRFLIRKIAGAIGKTYTE